MAHGYTEVHLVEVTNMVVLPPCVAGPMLGKRSCHHPEDDEGGFHQMIVYMAGSERGDAILEFWFHVSQPGREGGVWLRQMVVGIDEDRVYASIGGG